MKKGMLVSIVVCAILSGGCEGQQPDNRESNKQVVQQFITISNAAEWDQLSEVVAADFKRHSSATSGPPVRSLDEFIALQKSFLSTFPDQQVRLDSIIAEGNLVAIRATYLGTQTGPMGEFPATGKSVDGPFIAFFRIESGKIAELWVEWDNVSLLNQLGLLPPKSPAHQAKAEEVIIPRDTYHLRAKFYKAHSQEPAPLAIILRGIPGSDGDVLGLGQKLSSDGIHALVPNYSGTHGSGGEWTMANDKEDVQASFDFVRSPKFASAHSVDTSRIILGGYSHGGGVALLFSADNPNVDSVFSIGGNDFGEWARKTATDDAFAQLIESFFISYADAGLVRPAEGADQELLAHVERYDVKSRGPRLAGKRLLLVGGLDDQTVPIEDHLLPLYRALLEHGAEHVRVMAFQDDHGFGHSESPIANELINWIRSDE